jgi:hypothetical protein
MVNKLGTHERTDILMIIRPFLLKRYLNNVAVS